MKTNSKTEMEIEPSQDHLIIRFLDRLVMWTGIPQLTEKRIRRRPLKFFPIFVLAISTLVIVSVFTYPGHFIGKFLAIDFCFGAGALLHIFGPIKQTFNPNDFLDERDREIKRNAYFFTYTLTTFAAILCMISMIVTESLVKLDQQQLIWRLLSVLIFIVSLLTTLPTLHASWAMPRAIEDDE
ncbi:hypothetical protein H8K32_16250 [Undibacterium jejuense]|uniref:Uncharacterized protein n=1 Tax=Undibacterium jejuense TaxID=1344949 RepID=A0A923HK05_9BURK|nr:hypothetical protein [Undibacterium jejuense]MBC3863660.1 hypothetical protein [Undibacterium jejuense]